MALHRYSLLLNKAKTWNSPTQFFTTLFFAKFHRKRMKTCCKQTENLCLIRWIFWEIKQITRSSVFPVLEDCSSKRVKSNYLDLLLKDYLGSISTPLTLWPGTVSWTNTGKQEKKLLFRKLRVYDLKGNARMILMTISNKYFTMNTSYPNQSWQRGRLVSFQGCSTNH